VRAYDRYLLALAGAFALATGLLALDGETRLDLYYASYFLAYLAVTLAFLWLHPRARRSQGVLGGLLFLGLGALAIRWLVGLLT